MEQALTRPAIRSFESTSGALDIDFDEAPAPRLVTEILAACTPDEVSEAALWELPVGRRIECLLAILALGGEQTLWAQSCCSACGEPFEIDLTPAELIALAAEKADAHVVVELDGRTVDLRKPTGLDQLAWQSRTFAGDGEARRSVASELLASGAAPELDEELVAKVETALAELDPLVCFELDAVCPHCLEARAYELDLLRLVLERFREKQERLVDDVHALASRYHWTEAEVLAVPDARRARYLALIDLGRG